MTEIVGGVIGAAIQVVKCVAAPVKRQFNYLCCFGSNVSSLRDEAKKLDDATGGLQVKVTAAKNNVQVILPEVETWLRNSSDIKDNINRISNEVPNVQSGCLKLRARFSLSKRAKKTTDHMKELRGQCTFDIISQPALPAATEAVPLGTTYEFESRKQFEEDIMVTLRDKDVNVIGICGMGGVGKTTVAKRIMNRALEERLFDEVVMVVISQQVDKLRIQLEIGGSLGLKLEGETPQARVQKLHARLKGTKRILLVLDDVWKSLVLEDLGIPCGFKWCTILLTSRNMDVLCAMNVEKVCAMQILSEEEAWFLFKAKAGACVDDNRLNSTAKSIVNECKGLPIALATVGVALKDETSESIWKDALQQLRKSNPIDIPNIIEEVYKPLKLSYDFLDSEHAKSLFLLCCLFREDDDISVEHLTFFVMGLHIFEDIRNLEQARNRMCALIKMLKSRFLLLDSYDEDHVKMHDVVRDVCIFIAKQKGFIGGNDCSWISSFQLAGEGTELPTGLGFLNLRLLFLICNSREEEFKIEDTIFEGMGNMYILFIKYYSLTSLPHTTRSHKNLRTLILVSCRRLETISFVGELVNLEILICRDCGSIKELPPEMKGLNRLKLLELSGCKELQSIGRGIISSLVGLEELKMVESFDKWEAEEVKERHNAGLRELEWLTNLACLVISIKEPALAAEELHLSSKIVIFDVRITKGSYMLPEGFNRKLYLYWAEGTCLGHWIKMQLLTSTEYLYLIGEGAQNLDLAKARNLKELKLGYAPALKQLWESSRIGFTNLSSVQIWNCHSLRNLGLVTTAAKEYCLAQLESLDISECEMMQQVFLWSVQQDQSENVSVPRNLRITKVVFPKLKTIELSSLPNLTTFCQGIEGVEFPLLMEMSIHECPKMTSVVSTTSSTGFTSNQNDSRDSSHDDDDGNNQNDSGGSISNVDGRYNYDSFHLFCQPEKVSFGSLKELAIQWNGNSRNAFCRHKTHASSFNGLEQLYIYEYQGSMSLFTSLIARNLVNLRELFIGSCDEMVNVIEDVGSCDEMVNVIEDDEKEKKSVSRGGRTLLLPKLHKLILFDFRKLVTFCEWKFDVEMRSLREVRINGCPNMKKFTLGSLTTPNLRIFIIDGDDFGRAVDLNGALQRHLIRR